MPDQGAFARGWSVVKASIEVLRGHKILLAYPVAALVYTVSFGFLFLFFVSHSEWIVFAASYLSGMFAFTFTGVAFNHELMKAFSGERVSLRRGFAFALRRIKAIVLWSLFAGVVGLLIETIESHVGFVGKMIARITGCVWSVASVFAIPIMIREESSNPFELLRQSAAVIKGKWKEAPVAFAGGVVRGLLLYVFVFTMLGTLIGYEVVSYIVPALDFGDLGPGLLVFFASVWAVALLPYIIFDSIFRCALYIYASEGVVPAPYQPEMMDGAWSVK
jgi:hypothetical protein